ncbi:MAG: hypothetical protein BJ554DRAFT_3202, partial [Olpidium bornovanus]
GERGKAPSTRRINPQQAVVLSTWPPAGFRPHRPAAERGASQARVSRSRGGGADEAKACACRRPRRKATRPRIPHFVVGGVVPRRFLVFIRKGDARGFACLGPLRLGDRTMGEAGGTWRWSGGPRGRTRASRSSEGHQARLSGVEIN